MQNTQRRLRMQALGAELARIRKAAGMPKQEDLEARSGVSTRTISDIETGKKVARINTMRKIESALGLEPGATDDFMAGKTSSLAGQDGSPEDAADATAGEDEVAFVSRLIRRGWSTKDINTALDELEQSKRGLPPVEPPSDTNRAQNVISPGRSSDTGT